jgi:superfamily II DNA helicase RecQ
VQQAERFKKIGLTASAVNGETYTPELHKVSHSKIDLYFYPKIFQEIESRQVRVLVTSPEMCIEHDQFSKILRTPEYSKNMVAIIIDEAHCVSQWGESFQKKFAELGKLRSYVPSHVPFFATSATLPPHILEDVKSKLCFSPTTIFIINLGNERANITPMVCRMKGGAKDLAALDFVVDEAKAGKPLIRTVIFFNKREIAFQGFSHLQDQLPEDRMLLPCAPCSDCMLSSNWQLLDGRWGFEGGVVFLAVGVEIKSWCASQERQDTMDSGCT